MIDLYSSASPNVVKIFIALEEMGLPYRNRVVELMKGEQFSPEFAELNPLAKVPVIVDHDSQAGRPYTVFESGAILLYLADKSGQFLPTDIVGRFDAIQWLMMQMANVGPMFGQYVHFSRYAPPGIDSYAKGRYRTQVRRLLSVIETKLGRTPYIAGPQYSIADMAIFPWAQAIGFILGEGIEKEYPTIQKWIAGIAARPSVAKALGIVGDMRSRLTPPDLAPPEVLDRFFGRGAHGIQ